MKTIKTQSNSILAIEVPENASDFQIIHDKTRVAYFYPNYKRFDLPNKSEYKILGKLSELEDEELERFVEHSKKSLTNENTWRDYRFDEWEECFDVKESFISLLQSNGIDTSKELLIIEIL